MGFNDLVKNLETLVRRIKRISKIDKQEIKSIISELQRSLLLGDVNVNIVYQMTEKIKKEIYNSKELPQTRKKNFVLKLINRELLSTLGGKKAPIRIRPGKKMLFY